MSVMIKGMKMPKNCLECEIKSYDADAGEEYCPFSQIDCLSIGRQDNCPLVEVTTPHGRLIDVDEICFSMMTGIDQYLAEEAIRESPTVIEAEGE